MSGTLVFKPIEAKLTHDTDLFTKMNPYLQVILGEKKVPGEVSVHGGKYPKWETSITIHRNYEKICYIEVKDKEKFLSDEIIGVGQIDLEALKEGDNPPQWHSLYYKQKPAGEILIETKWTPYHLPHGHGHHSHHNIHPHFKNHN